MLSFHSDHSSFYNWYNWLSKFGIRRIKGNCFEVKILRFKWWKELRYGNRSIFNIHFSQTYLCTTCPFSVFFLIETRTETDTKVVENVQHNNFNHSCLNNVGGYKKPTQWFHDRALPVIKDVLWIPRTLRQNCFSCHSS